MKQTTQAIGTFSLVLLGIVSARCHSDKTAVDLGEDNITDGGAFSDSDSDSDADSKDESDDNGDVDSDSDTDNDGDSESETDADSDVDNGVDSDQPTDADTQSDASKDRETDDSEELVTNNDTAVEIATDTNKNSDSDADENTNENGDTGADTHLDIDSHTDTDGDTDTDTDAETNGDCDYSEPPSNVAAWVDESWQDQLDDNIGSRTVWLLDKAIKGEGTINLCVRWGATSPPSSDVKESMAIAVERWLNHWFTALGDYGCFPYPDGVRVVVTGWAVRPGNESWISDLDSSIFKYSKTDVEGEPICPSACSTFDNWDYNVPACPGGDAARTDYWIWLDDTLDGAAAVGGDWGVRMPVNSFVNVMDNEGDFVIEHEMGHGFGFQDYYEWNGSRPEGGSLMIVGSTSSQTPTTGDTWLIRRTWKEMQIIRGW